MTLVQILLFLACPVMMLFCMKGMFTGNKDKNTKIESNPSQVSQAELQSLQIKMADLIEQNQNLTKEIKLLKEQKGPTVVLKKNA